MVAHSCRIHGRSAALNLFIALFIHGCLCARIRQRSSISHPRDDSRKACENVTLQPPKSSSPGHFSFNNANASAYIQIEDEDVHAWNTQTHTAGNQTITLPSVHIGLVSVDCVLKGLCKDMVTVAINHWRFEYKQLEGNADFGVSLLFAADPAIAGCICYMDAMMLGHLRKRLYVRTKSDMEVSTHEGFVTVGEDIKLDDMFKGASFTKDQAAQACLTMIPGCQGFSMKGGPPEDPATQFPIEDFHFKSQMGMQDLGITMDPWTSYRVLRSSPRPYELQYEPRDGRHWYREWCVRTFQAPSSPLQGRSWLFL